MSSIITPPTTEPGKTRTWKDYFSWFLYFLRLLTIVVLIMNLISYCLVIKIGITSDKNSVLQKSFIFLSNFGLGLLVIALIIAEFQFVWFVKRVLILHYWAGRGFGQSWMGIQLIASATQLGSNLANETGGDSDAMQTFAEVSGWILFSIGLLLIIMSAMCLRDIVGMKADKDLQAALLADGSRSTVVIQHSASSSTTSSSKTIDASADKLKKEVEDLQGLVQNLSTAMGISYVVASSKFGGKAGAQAAENFQRDMKQKEAQLKNAAASAGNAAKQEYTRMSNVVENTANNVSNAASSTFSPKENDQPSASSSSSSSRVNVPADDEEPVGRRKKAFNDEELERMYYGK